MNTSKRSRQREAILEVLRMTKVHPTADWVYNEVRKEIPNISLGTVYRNLARLSEDKNIIKLGLGTGVEHFDGCVEPHYHAVCTCCGAISDIEAKQMMELNDWASKQFNGEIYEHSAVFYGKCEKCKNNIY